MIRKLAVPSLAAAVTHYTADDGQDIGNIAWTPDGRSIVYVHFNGTAMQ